MEENQFWVRIWTILGAVAIAIALIVAAYNAYTTNVYVSKGYTIQAMPGTSPQWVKP